MADSIVIPQQPQTDKAVKINDPLTIDDSHIFTYNAQNNFLISTYATLIQDTTNTITPASFPNDNGKTYAPTTAPFIIQIIGSGFNALKQLNNPLQIYANIEKFVAIIPQLPTSSKLSRGMSYGYTINSDTSIWIYFSRVLFQDIWFVPSPDITSYDGHDVIEKTQIESATSSYAFLSSIPELKLFIAPNNGTISFKSNFFSQKTFKTITIPLTQSPYILTLLGAQKGNVIQPFLLPSNNSVVRSLSLFGHGLQDKKVLMVKTSSLLLAQNTSALPKEVLNADQSSSAIQSFSAQKIAQLEYFKVGNFLEDLQTIPEHLQTTDYSFFAADGTIKNSGKNGHLPTDNLPTIKFNILTLPTGTYYVVVYDPTNGSYSIAPSIITITAGIGGMQIHDVTPKSVVLQNPTFTINGFNFPTTDELNNGAIFSVLITNTDTLINDVSNTFGAVLPITRTAALTIDKTSTTNDISGNGSITLSATQVIAKYTNLNVILTPNDSTNVFIQLQVTYPTNVPTIGKINDTEISKAIAVEASPVIQFLTNSEKNPNPNKSLVSVDQNTGQVITNAIATNDLFVVGNNFGDGSNISVSIDGNAQHINEVKPWTPNTELSAIRVTVDPSNLKGDVTLSVTMGKASSEPYIVAPDFSLETLKTITNSKGIVSSGKQSIITPFFESILPVNRDGYTLLNSKNTKVSASLPIQLCNLTTKQSVTLNGKLDANSLTSISFLPNQIVIPDNTPLNSNGVLEIIFNFYSVFNVNISTPKIVKLLHNGIDLDTPFNPGDIMTVLGNGFVNGMRFNINKTGWKPVDKLFTFSFDTIVYQAFEALVPDSNGSSNATIQVSNEQAQNVSSVNTSAKQNGAFQVKTIVVNDKYSPLLKINQRLPAGIKMYAKGPQVAMTDLIDANMSIYSQITPFLGSFKTLLVVIRVIVCIIDVICALINPFQLVIAIIALMDCIIDLLSLFPQLAIPIMILSFLQNFIGFLQTLITQIETYVLSIVNAELALGKAQLSKDFATLAAAEQQAFAVTKQINDAVAFLEPALQIIQVFKDLLSFAMHFPCAANQGGTQDNKSCPPKNIQQLIDGNVANNNITSMTDDQRATLATMFCQAVSIQTTTLKTMPGFNTNTPPFVSPGSTSVIPTISPNLPNVAGAIECMNNLTANIENALNNGQIFITTQAQGQELISAYTQCLQNLIDQTNQSIGDICVLAVSALNSELRVSPKGSANPDLRDDFVKTKIAFPSTQPNDLQDAGLVLDLATITNPAKIPTTITTDLTTGSMSASQNFGLKPDVHTPIIIQTTNKSGQRQPLNAIYFNAENPDVGDLIVPGDILEIVGGAFGGLQFPILTIQKIFTAVRLTCKLDITFEQKLLVGEQAIPENLSGFDVKVIAHLAGNDDVAVLPADNQSIATISIIARDHHGHELGSGLANKIAVNIDSGDAVFVPITPSNTTDITGVIQENGTHYIANIKSDCAGTVIASASVCGITIEDVGYHANDPNHTITTRKKTIKIIFTPLIPKPTPDGFNPINRPQEPGTKIPN